MKFWNCFTDKDNGESLVRIIYKKHFYAGKAKLHPDDNWSEFTGCRYAQERAEINALKDEYRQKKQACDECKKFVAAVQQYSRFNSEDPSARAMFRQLNRRIREVNKLADKINLKEFNLKVAIRQQDEFNKKITKTD